ncbi:MAG: TonB-dependent receptor [Proteobacteria bacterium]|nr:TonB-dependent receptor [Pseudomonadota bacterium]
MNYSSKAVENCSSSIGKVLSIIAVSLLIGAPAVAQVLEEIIVTASKRPQTLQEIPVAVSVVTADDLKQTQILDIKDLQFLIPSLRVDTLQSSGNTNFRIRGFGNGANNAGIEPSVGVFIDGVYRSRTASALGDLPNLERVEVLRGPQSTLFGKNASAGVISVITAKPSLVETTGNVSLTVGEYSQTIVKADVNGPFSDSVGFSLSGYYNQRDGYYDNLAGGKALGELNRYGVRGQLLFAPSDALEIRFIADYDDFDEACCGVANLLNGPTGGAVVAIGGNLVPNEPFAYQGYYDFTPVNQFQTDGVSMQIDWDLNDSMTLTSITAQRSLSRFDNVDIDFTSAELLDPMTANRTETEIDTFTQEFRLSGATDTMNWMVGAYFFDEEVDQTTGVLYGDAFRAYADILTGGVPGNSILNTIEFLFGHAPGTFQGAGQGLIDVSTMDDTAFSIFGQIDIDLSDRVTLTLGANYTEDEKDVTFNSIGTDVYSNTDLFNDLTILGITLPTVFFGQAFTDATMLDPTPENIAFIETVAPGTSAAIAAGVAAAITGLQGLQFLAPTVNYPNSVETGNTKDDDTTWTVRLAFDLTDSVNAYFSAGTGFKATSWNLSRDSRPFPQDQAAIEAAGLTVPNLIYTTRYAAPEYSTVYEIGLKARWDTVALNLAIFDQDIEGFQSNTFTGTGFKLANAGKRSAKGLEVDIRWQPTESFQASLGATFMDPLFDSFVDGAGVGGVTDLSGTTPDGIHEVSILASGTYRFTMGNADGFVRADYLYEDKVPVISNVPGNIATREVSTINASAGLAWENGFELMLWGRNLNNDEYLTSAFPSVAQAGSYSGYPNQPRTYGLTLRKSFN